MTEKEKISSHLLLGNKLFHHFFPLYKILYPFYKRFSDKHEITIVKNYIKPDMTVVDIGANIGFYTNLMSKLVGEKGRVYAFEPSPQNFNLLQKYNRNNNVTLIQAAVAQSTGQIPLYISDKLNVDHRTYKTDEDRETVNVPSYRLDDYLKNQKVDFIKMDVQGFEYNALLGMENILKNNPQIKLLMEYWPYGLIQAGTTPEKLFAFLGNLGFQAAIIDSGQRKKCPPIPAQKDFAYYQTLFISR